MKTKLGLCLSLAVFLAFVALVGSGGGQEETSPWDRLGKPATALRGLQWIKGGPVQIKKGSVYVVEFWATWCPPCRASIPHLTELQRRFKEKGVTIIGISNETADIVKPFVQQMAAKMDYTVAIDTGGQATKGYVEAFNIRGIPHAFIVGKDGNLLWYGHPMAAMDTVLDKVVAEDFDAVTYAREKAAEEKEQARLEELYKEYFATIGRDISGAAEAGVQIVEGSTNSMMLNAFAWKILTDVSEQDRDLELARRAALKAVELTDEKNAAVLDTYALALYELGRKYVGQAVTYQKKAVALAEKDRRMRQGLQKALERYESASLQ
ncbi:MAG: TlpA family protein disulfide reductase [Planctomycetota bacterium]|jgi:thiol-disulfide isomerase/thioredoxin